MLSWEFQSTIGKWANNFSRLSSGPEHGAISILHHTIGNVYKAGHTFLCCSKIWPKYLGQERKLNSFHMRCHRSICGVACRDKIRSEAILQWLQLPVSHLQTRRLCWLGHVRRLLRVSFTPNDSLCWSELYVLQMLADLWLKNKIVSCANHFSIVAIIHGHLFFGLLVVATLVGLLYHVINFMLLLT